MNPIKRTVSVPQLAQMLRQLSALRATASQQLLVQKVWLGFDVHNLVQQSGLYRCADFYRLAERLGYKKQVTVLIDLIVRSGGFTVGVCPKSDHNRYGVLWFASPVFFNESELKRAIDARQEAGSLPLEPTTMNSNEVDSMFYGGLWDFTPKTTPDLGLYDSIINYTGANNIILSGGRSLRPAAFNDGGGTLLNDNVNADPNQAPINHNPSTINRKGNSPFKMPPINVREQEVDRFIEELRQSPTHGKLFLNLQMSLMKPMKNGIEQHSVEHFTKEQAKEIIRALMYDQIKPYFLEQPDFFRYSSFTSRKAWLQNLIYSRFGQKLMAAARKTCKARWNRDKRKQEAQQAANIRNNRPLSPHEWMENDIRYYDDPEEGTLIIPSDAPPRPSSDAIWDKFRSMWVYGL